jgi:hypothetical protein
MTPSLPPGLEKLMPVKGEAGLRKVANDRTLFVTLPKESEAFPCHMLAQQALHAAQDGGYGNICILKNSGAHKHNFAVLDLIKKTKVWAGQSLWAWQQCRGDSWFDERKKFWVLGHRPNPDAKISLS